jgi:D-lactate dehydrogenase (cytochrome)
MIFKKLTKKQIMKLKSFVKSEHFSFGESNLDLHSKDQSRHPPRRPEAVIWPREKSEVSEILRYANQHMIPVTGWGAGTSVEGNPIPVHGGLVVDFSLMDRILEIRAEEFQADVEPGVIYQDLNEKLRYKGLFFPPDPGARATIGGMIANNASGSRTVRYGATKDNIMRLVVALASGEVIEVGTKASKSSSGYDLVHLFVGSEGTLGLVVEATVCLKAYPEEFSAAVANFSNVQNAGKAVFNIMRTGFDPAALEILDPKCIELINKEKNLDWKVLPTLFMEFHGPSKLQLTQTLEIVQEICKEEGCREFRAGIGKNERDALFKTRHELGEIQMRSHPGRAALATDVAVPLARYADMIAIAGEVARNIDIPAYISSHAGDGNIHLVLMGKMGDENEWDIIDKVNHRMTSKAIEMGGTATGEHGVGLGKRKFMEAEHGKSLAWMKRIKNLFDPNGILNPGKLFPD